MLWIVDLRRDRCPACSDAGDVGWKFGVEARSVVEENPVNEFLCLLHLKRRLQDLHRAMKREPELRGEMTQALALLTLAHEAGTSSDDPKRGTNTEHRGDFMQPRGPFGSVRAESRGHVGLAHDHFVQ